MRELAVEVANLTLRFGNKVLLDLAEQIVIPAFTDKNLVRTYGDTRYFFYGVKKVTLEAGRKPVLGIAGRIVKDTKIVREQIYDTERGLVRNRKALRSAPSAFFLLILNNHRLLYIRETSDAPPKAAFRTTLLSFLRTKYKEHIDKEHEKAKESSNLVTKKQLMESLERPTLQLIPLTSGEGIEEFVSKYEVLQVLEFKLGRRNDENDNEPFFEQLQEKKDELGSNVSSVRHQNASGLNKTRAREEIAEATQQGNQLVRLSGLDQEGDRLLGNNENFQLRKPIGEIGANVKSAAEKAYRSFKSLVADGIVKLPAIQPEVLAKVRELARRFPGE